MYLKAAALCLALVVSASAAASANPAPLDLDKIRQQQAEIRQDAQSRKGLYRDMPASTRSQLFSKQEQVLAIIDGKNTADQLSESQQMEVFNALEWIEAAINSSEDERMVCERRTTIGSNRKERVCMTVGEQRRQREIARERLLDGDPFGMKGQ